MRYDQSMMRVHAIRAMKWALVPMILVCLGEGPAALGQQASTSNQPLIARNSCDWNITQFRTSASAPLMMEFAKTGKVPDPPLWQPILPRTWYIAAFGMRQTLERYLAAHPNAVRGSTLLNGAIYAGRRKIVSMLLQRGANPNGPGHEKDEPPLMVAAQCGRPVIMRKLLQAGANVYGTDTRGQMVALAPAIVGPGWIGPFYEGVKLILAAGFDPRCPIDKRGATALYIIDKNIRLSGYKRLRRLLRKDIKAVKAQHPNRPACGGLDWWPKKTVHSN